MYLLCSAAAQPLNTVTIVPTQKSLNTFHNNSCSTKEEEMVFIRLHVAGLHQCKWVGGHYNGFIPIFWHYMNYNK